MRFMEKQNDVNNMALYNHYNGCNKHGYKSPESEIASVLQMK